MLPVLMYWLVKPIRFQYHLELFIPLIVFDL